MISIYDMSTAGNTELTSQQTRKPQFPWLPTPFINFNKSDQIQEFIRNLSIRDSQIASVDLIKKRKNQIRVNNTSRSIGVWRFYMSNLYNFKTPLLAEPFSFDETKFFGTNSNWKSSFSELFLSLKLDAELTERSEASQLVEEIDSTSKLHIFIVP